MGPRLWADHKTRDCPLVQTEVRQDKGQRTWLKQKSPRGEPVCGAHTSLSCGLPFLGSSVDSLAAPCCSYRLVSDLPGAYSSTQRVM